MLYSQMPVWQRAFAQAAYASVRITRGDVIGGVGRRLRRYRGVYLDDCEADLVEYHSVRDGVDPTAITRELENAGYACQVSSYFSTWSAIWLRTGQRLGVANQFAVIAERNRLGR